MTSDHFGRTDASAMGVDHRHTNNSPGDISSRFNSLIQEMAEDHKAVAGTTLPAYRAAQTELAEAFNGLMSWCQTRDVDLSAFQRKASATESHSKERFPSSLGNAALISDADA